MKKEEIKKFVQYFLDCLPPDYYINNIINNREKYKNELIIEIDINHKISNII